MGYRSEIAIRIEVPTCTTAEKLLERINKDYVILEKLFDEIVVKQEAYFEAIKFEVIKLHASYVKWYDSFNDVCNFNRFLDDFGDECEETNEELKQDGAYHFLRIGEDWGDIEEKYRGNLFSYMSLVRSIDWE